MARDGEIVRRLTSWARWRSGLALGGLGFARVDMAGALAADRGGYRESTIPAMDAEAAETDQAVQELDSHLRRTVEVVYLHGGSMARKAQVLACAESTLYARLCQADVALRRWIVERHRAREAERRRVKAVTAAAAGRSFTD